MWCFPSLSSASSAAYRHVFVRSKVFPLKMAYSTTTARPNGVQAIPADTSANQSLGIKPRTLALGEEEDVAEIREKYRPFIFKEKQVDDWVDSLELDTVMDMAEKNILATPQRLRVLVLYGSLRKRYASLNSKNRS